MPIFFCFIAHYYKRMMRFLLLFIAPLLSVNASFADTAGQFETWKSSFIKASAKKGLAPDFLRRQLKGVSYQAAIVEKDRNQVTLDTTINYQKWIKKWLGSTPDRVERGRELLKKHQKVLTQIERQYQVDKEAIVALWGVETLYGNITGNHDIVSVLSTLAYDKRRRSFFEKELFAALKILSQGHISRENFKGSWAGAMGQNQFMPTSFLMYAKDFDGDGKKDIWKNEKDAFASIAYYLKRAGWQKGNSIGMLAKKTRDVNLDYGRLRRPAQYNQLGLRQMDGSKIEGDWRRKIATIPHKNSPLILRGSNYKVIMKWNRSSLFAALNIILMQELGYGKTL